MVQHSGTFPFVVLGLHSSCCLCKSLFRFLVDKGHCFCEVSGSGIREWGCSRRVGKNSWISAVQYHERTLLRGAVDAIVVHELSEREPVAPICLSMVDKDSEVLLDLLIHSFSLSVGLWMECRRGIRRDVEHLVKFLHEL